MVKALTRQNVIRLLSVTCLILIVSTAAINPQKASAQTDSFFNKHYEWDYKSQHWTWDLSVPTQLYYAYKNVPVSNRTQYGVSGYGFLTTTKDTYVQSLAKELNDTANQLGYDAFDKVSFALAFVQSLPYTSDSVTTGHDDYPRFPIETLVDDGGDCEDTSILFATLSLIMGFEAVYINPPGHCAGGILGNNLKGTYWIYPESSNQTYYYCETTGSGFMIGELPFQYLGQGVNIYSIDATKQFIPRSIFTAPTVNQPNSEQIFPQLSINIVTDNPLLIVLGMFSGVVAFAFVFTSVRRPKTKTIKAAISPSTNPAQSKLVDLES
jgi:hypothetical protein